MTCQLHNICAHTDSLRKIRGFPAETAHGSSSLPVRISHTCEWPSWPVIPACAGMTDFPGACSRLDRVIANLSVGAIAHRRRGREKRVERGGRLPRCGVLPRPLRPPDPRPEALPAGHGGARPRPASLGRGRPGSRPEGDFARPHPRPVDREGSHLERRPGRHRVHRSLVRSIHAPHHARRGMARVAGPVRGDGLAARPPSAHRAASRPTSGAGRRRTLVPHAQGARRPGASHPPPRGAPGRGASARVPSQGEQHTIATFNMRSAGSGRIGSCACWPAAWNGACAAPGRHRGRRGGDGGAPMASAPRLGATADVGMGTVAHRWRLRRAWAPPRASRWGRWRTDGICAAPGRHRGRRGGDGGAPMAPAPRLGAAAVRRRDPGRRPAHPRPRRPGPTHPLAPGTREHPGAATTERPFTASTPCSASSRPAAATPAGFRPAPPPRPCPCPPSRRRPGAAPHASSNRSRYREPPRAEKSESGQPVEPCPTRGARIGGRPAPGTPASRRHGKTPGSSGLGAAPPRVRRRPAGTGRPGEPGLGDAPPRVRRRPAGTGRLRGARIGGRPAPGTPASRRHGKTRGARIGAAPRRVRRRPAGTGRPGELRIGGRPAPGTPASRRHGKTRGASDWGRAAPSGPSARPGRATRGASDFGLGGAPPPSSRRLAAEP